MVSARGWPPGWPNLALICSIVSATPFSSMSERTTLAPSRAKISAAASPIPLAAPVMTTVFPLK